MFRLITEKLVGAPLHYPTKEVMGSIYRITDPDINKDLADKETIFHFDRIQCHFPNSLVVVLHEETYLGQHMIEVIDDLDI